MPSTTIKVLPLVAVLSIFISGCQEQTREPQTRPAEAADDSAQPIAAESSEPTTQPARPIVIDTGPEPVPRVPPKGMPKRPKASWVIFRSAFTEENDATCTAEWTGGNRLEVHTDNIQRLTLDLTRLPAGAPQTGPWNLQIDEQGIQVTGFRGKVLDLVRSKNGNWTVDRKKHKRRD
jgi:hypothetical protein